MRALDDPSEVILYLNFKDGLVRTVDHSLPSASPRLRVKYPSSSPRLRVIDSLPSASPRLRVKYPSSSPIHRVIKEHA